MEDRERGGYGPWVAVVIALAVAWVGMEVMGIEPIDVKMNLSVGGCK